MLYLLRCNKMLICELICEKHFNDINQRHHFFSIIQLQELSRTLLGKNVTEQWWPLFKVTIKELNGSLMAMVIDVS